MFLGKGYIATEEKHPKIKKLVEHTLHLLHTDLNIAAQVPISIYVLQFF